MKNKILSLALIIPLLNSCSQLASFNNSLDYTNEGGKVPETFQYQNYKFRTGAAFMAAQLGAVGVRQTSGKNVFVIKDIPKISNIALVKTASFTRSEGSTFKMVNELNLSDIKGLDLGLEQENQTESKESGVYTIYYIANVRKFVEQLNQNANKDVLDELRLTKEARIITGIVKVSNHNLYNKSQGKFKFNAKILAALEKEGTAKATTKDGAVKIKDDQTSKKTKEEIATGLRIANGGVRAYEYSRVIWNKETGQIIDLLVDRPSPWYTFGDATDHDFDEASNDPKDIKEKLKF